MKASKFLSAALIAVSVFALTAEAGSIGRSSSSSSSRSSSSSSSFSSSRSSAPTAAPAPSRPGGIGGTTASVGVRKSEVTAPVQNQVAQSKPAPTAPSVGNVGSTSHSAPSPTYGTANAPVYVAPSPAPSSGSTFMSSFGGSMLGSMVGNSLSNNHGSGTTVINNGTPSGSNYSGGGPISSAQAQTIGDSQFNPGAPASSNKKEYTVWSFIADLIGFVFVVAILLGVAWLFYKGYQLVRGYINKERGVSTHPFNATQRFWEIQKAFATADLTTLQKLLGPDVVDELTNDLQPQQGLTVKNVSHEIRLENSHEFSIWYKFFETDGEEINQVWHYERFGSEWKLNGIENV